MQTNCQKNGEYIRNRFQGFCILNETLKVVIFKNFSGILLILFKCENKKMFLFSDQNIKTFLLILFPNSEYDVCSPQYFTKELCAQYPSWQPCGCPLKAGEVQLKNIKTPLPDLGVLGPVVAVSNCEIYWL